MTRFSNRTVIVTGGASGIGLASARRFHAEGANVVIADLADAPDSAIVDEFDAARLLYVQCNVGNWDQVQALVDAAVIRFGGLDVMFNNAGIGRLGNVVDLPLEEWQSVMDVTLSGAFYGCRAAIPAMRERGGGAIVNMASASGLAADYGFSAYNAAKGGVINLTRAVAIDHARENIRVNAVCPGPIATPPKRNFDRMEGVHEDWQGRVPAGRYGGPDEVAAVVAFLASDDASYVTGSAIPVDGGLLAHTGQPNFPALTR